MDGQPRMTTPTVLLNGDNYKEFKLHTIKFLRLGDYMAFALGTAIIPKPPIAPLSGGGPPTERLKKPYLCRITTHK
jgi:hypothetical protein